ncbi:PAS domain-containing sensor histidine kinase [Desulforamulus ferrireducens]|uniref:histidine kinase n=1 Tax=Desulforamulus ferrireducens TaxID=1833852 RepID=A0A1S6ITH6_9FIRM|nr:PAS domain-containing sensor histidine kinase [Desulforamulus ferrireducens]AQS58078.1 hypothetical protein B0537_02590 [Desulforamulus ferrireducens]
MISKLKDCDTLLSEFWYKVFNVIPHPMAISVYSTGHYIKVNESFLTTFGYSEEEVIGKSFSSLRLWVNEEDREKAIKLLLDAGRLRDYEVLIRTKSEEIKVCSFSAEFIDINGEKYVLSHLTDITERKKMEENLKKEQQRIFSVLDELPGIVALMSEDLAPKYANKAFKALFGEDDGRPCYEVIGKKEPCEVCYTKLLFEKKQPINWEMPVKDIAIYDTYEKLIYDVDGSPLALKVGIDITKRKKAEQELLYSEEKYRTFFENSMDGILLAKEDGTFIAANQALCQMVGMSEEELYQAGKERIFDWSDGTMQELELALQKKGKARGEVKLIHKELSKVPVEVSMQTFSRSNGELYTSVIFRDLSEKIKINQELSRLDRLNIIGQIAAGIGHEVRNPLTTIRGFLQILGKKPKYIEDKEYFDLMIEELDRTNNILSEFLSLGKDSSNSLEVHNLNKIIQDLYPLLQADALNSGKDIIVEQQTIPDMELNRKEIHQLILNLARNGLEAMSAGGTLSIQTFMEGEQVVLAVCDEGVGIAADILDKLGTPFLTTKADGTGLGLATCYNIAARHNASIKVETGPKGTTFFVKFKRNE